MKTPISFDDAQECIERYVDDYNYNRLHSAIGYVTPNDKLQGNDEKIFEERKQKLKDAYKKRIAHHESKSDVEL